MVAYPEVEVFHCTRVPEITRRGDNFHVIERCDGRVISHRVYPIEIFTPAVDAAVRLLTSAAPRIVWLADWRARHRPSRSTA